MDLNPKDHRLPAALVNNSIQYRRNPGQCKELMASLCPHLENLPDIKLAGLNVIDQNTNGEKKTSTGPPPIEQKNSENDGEDQSECEVTSNITRVEQCEDFNLFLDNPPTYNTYNNENGWMRAFQVLRDRYESSSCIRALLDLLVMTRTCVQWLADRCTERETHPRDLTNEQMTRIKHLDKQKIKLIKWHPTLHWCGQYAIALVTEENLAYVYYSHQNEPTILNVLTGSCVFCMDWTPFSLTLVLGHQHGLHIFTVRPRSHFPTSTLARHNHCPITDLSISPDGHSMVTISLQSMDVCLWNLTDYSVVKLFGYFTAPNFLVRWSPTGLRVAVATTRASLQFYNVLDSSCTKWAIPRGHVSHLVWSPDDCYVLFANSEDTRIHFIQLTSVTGIDDKKANLLVDTSSIWQHCTHRSNPGNNQDENGNDQEDSLNTTDAPNREPNVGDEAPMIGRSDNIQCLALDSQGKFLAVAFVHAPVIGLFKLHTGINMEIWSTHRLEIWPAFDRLACMDFLPSCEVRYQGMGTVLTLAWNNGDVQHFPIVNTFMGSLI